MGAGSIPHANIGIATGKVSGFLVVDLDPRSGSSETLAQLAKAGKVFGDTVEAVSPRDGRHLYFAYDPRVTISKANALGPGIDVKTDGGYIVAPPSFWREQRPVLQVAAAAAWCRSAEAAAMGHPRPAAAARATQEAARSRSTSATSRATAGRRWRTWGRRSERMATLSDGRHEAPFKVASALGKYVTHKLLTETDVETAVMDACSLNGALRKYSRNDLLKQVRNGLKKASGDHLPPLARVHRAAPAAIARAPEVR